VSFPRYPKYKPSGVEWLGEVPEHWSVTRLKSLCRLVTEKAEARSRAVALEHVESGTGRLIGDAGEFEGEGTAFVEGDLLFGKLRPYLAKAWVADSKGEAVGDFHVMRATRRLCERYLLYTTLNRDFIQLVDGSTYGSKMPRASWEFMGCMPLCEPSLAEQRAIAAFLDRETAKIDALIAEQENLIELLAEKRQAVISHAVTKGLNPAAPLKPSGIEWLGDVPAHWTVQRLGNLLREAPCYGVLVPDFEPDGVPMLRIQDMTASTIVRGDLTTISVALSQQYRRTVVDVGDLVLSVVGTIGESLVIDEQLRGVNLSRAVARLQLGHELSPHFCQWIFLGESFRRYTDLICVGTAQRVLNMTDLRAFRVAAPPTSEQESIHSILTARARELDSLAAR
jgi:type I restriction enzyme, S subunit